MSNRLGTTTQISCPGSGAGLGFAINVNRLRASDGVPAVLDPFIHYGWAERDLYNCLMFGGFPERFCDAYLESHPLESGWRERSQVFYILHLLSGLEHGQGWGQTWLAALLARFGA